MLNSYGAAPQSFGKFNHTKTAVKSRDGCSDVFFFLKERLFVFGFCLSGSS